MKTGEEIKNVRHLLIGALALTLAVPPTPAQKIDKETASREHVVRVQTAMNHLTVIEVGRTCDYGRCWFSSVFQG